MPSSTLLGAVAAVSLIASGCGSGSGSNGPTIAPAQTFHLARFRPAVPVHSGRPTPISFTIIQPSGAPLTAYKTGSGPHTGVDLIIVRSDDSSLLYEDTDISGNGQITQPVLFPSAGRYRIIIDAYPKQTGCGDTTKLPAPRLDQGRRYRQATTGAAGQPSCQRRRLPVRAPRPAVLTRDPSRLPEDQRA